MNVLVRKEGENKAVWCTLNLQIEGALCNFGAFAVYSRDLAAHLAGCRRVILFAATAGVMIDREIQKQTRLSPSRAYEAQMEGTRLIERFCDALCVQFAKEQKCKLRTRFSPGYGDLSLEVQREVFRVLDPAKHIGLCLGESCVMTPSKSVTAFVGVEE